jgi:hypothetical protein
VSTDKATYTQGEKVVAKVSIMQSGKPLTGSSFSLKMQRPNGSVTGLTMTTAGATVTWYYTVRSSDPAGSFVITATASSKGMSGTGTATFKKN